MATEGIGRGPNPPGGAAVRRRLVVDEATRVFHALFGLGLAGAWLSADSERWRALHVALGLATAALLVFRIAWGVTGPRHVRLANRLRQLAATAAALRARSRADAGEVLKIVLAATVLGLMAIAGLLAATGWPSFAGWGGIDVADRLGDLHGTLGDAAIMLALVHGLAALAVGRFGRSRGRSVALSMVDGRVPGPGPDLIRDRRRGLALALIAGSLVVGYAAWPTAEPDAATRTRRSEAETQQALPAVAAGFVAKSATPPAASPVPAERSAASLRRSESS